MEFEDLVVEAEVHRVRFTLWCRMWDEFQQSVALDWVDHPFEDGEVDNIPSSPGVYAFLVQPRLAGGLDVSYLLYIGESGNLKRRFRDYLDEVEDQNARPRIVIYLNRYLRYLRFCCATLPSNVSTTDIEDELLAAFIPPLNKKLPARVRRVVNAFL